MTYGFSGNLPLCCVYVSKVFYLIYFKTSPSLDRQSTATIGSSVINGVAQLSDPQTLKSMQLSELSQKVQVCTRGKSGKKVQV